MSLKVSVIVAAYNGQQYIDQCISNLLAQTYQNCEFLIVDDGSKDDTGVLLDEAAKKDSRIRVIHQENKGLSGARNTGISNATGDYLVFWDVDDLTDAATIEDNIKLAEEYDADVVFYSFRYHDVDTGAVTPNPMPSLFVGDAEEFFRNELILTMNQEVFNAPWNKLVRASFFREDGLCFERRIYEDIIFASNMLCKVNKIVVNPKEYYTYFVRSSGNLLSGFHEELFDCVCQYHANAMRYCEKYENNEEQIRRMNLLFVRLTLTQLKKISIQKKLSIGQKNKLICEICDNEQLRYALINSNVESDRKEKMKRMIIGKRINKIRISYHFLHALQKMHLVKPSAM